MLSALQGHDTTSAGMNWALHLIGCHPEIQAKIQQEVDNVFGDEDRDVSFDDLRNLSYLECCLKEALRLFPSVPMFGRWVKEENYLLGTANLCDFASYAVKHPQYTYWQSHPVEGSPTMRLY